MSLRRWQTQYHWHRLTTGERDRITENHELDLSMRTIATRVGENHPTLCHMMESGRSMCTLKRKWCTMSKCTERRIRQLTIRDPFSAARDIRSRLPPGAGGSVSIPTICNRLHEKYSNVQGYQQQ
ncbi:hypothetical protein TNCV_3637851 [Trichonephila clavipes]|nr:hypothetical protein TNCV_3637851 [Trichonephila clavipes]